MNIQKGYKNSPIGVIPEEWEVKELGELGTFSKGKGINKEQVKEFGLPCIRYGEIYTIHNYVVKNFNSYIDELTALESQKINKNDILFAGSGETIEDIGKSVAFTKDEKAFAGGDIIILSINNSVDVECLAYLLETDYSRKQKRKLGQGNSVVHIYSSSLKGLKIALPPLPEQRRIAALLSTWDKGIDTLSALLTQLQHRKKYLAQQLLSGEKRLEGFEGKWKRVSAGDIFKSVSQKGFDNEELLSATQDKGIIPRSMLEARVTMPSGEITGFKLVEKGNFVISLRSFQGGLEYSNYRGLVSPAYTVLEAKKEIDDSFYREYFKSYDFIGHLAVAVIGIRDGKQISYEDFCFVKIPYPSYNEQTAIAQVLDTAVREIQLVKQQLEALKTQKKGLMQVLLTGKKRLIIDN